MRKFKTLALAFGIAFAMVIAPVTALAGELGDTTEETTTTTTTTTTTASQSDSSLAELGISPGTISPSFSSTVTEYYATLEAGTTEIKVFATPNSSAAGIAWVTGSKTLVDGENTVKVCCGAPNGDATVYIIHVTVGSGTTSTTDTSTGTSTDTSTTTDTSTSTDTSTDASTQTDTNTGTDTSTTTDTITDATIDGDTAIEGDVVDEVTSAEDDGELEDGSKRVRAKLDRDGNLIYKKKVYSLNSDIPSGDYVSTEKYNSIYEQYQAARKKNTMIIIIAAIVAVVLIIVIINLIMRIKDKKEELETFYANEPFGDAPGVEPNFEPKREAVKRTESVERTRVPEPVAPTPAPSTVPSSKAAPAPKKVADDTSDDDIEFIDLD